VQNVRSMVEIVFVCTGNTCRSPMAEGLLRDRIPAAWRPLVRVSSAGVYAWEGQPASAMAVSAMSAVGIDISGHRARVLTPSIIHGSSLLVAMAAEHRERINRIAPGAGEWTILIGELDPGRNDPDIEDPIGGDAETYSAVRNDIEGLIGPLLRYMSENLDLSPGGEREGG